MDLEFDPYEDYLETMFYAQTLEEDDTLCLICQVDEIDEHNKQRWHRYKLKCGHIYHTRCLRRWCHRKDTLNCTLCGDIDEKPANMWCDFCSTFGHGGVMQGCPRIRQAIPRRYR